MLKCWLTSMKVLIGHLYIEENLLYMEKKETAKEKVSEKKILSLACLLYVRYKSLVLCCFTH